MPIQVREIQSSSSTELYITVTPDQATSARELFAQALSAAKGARICRERVFVPAGRLEEYRLAREQTYGHLKEQICDSWLHAGGNGPVGGIQLHAIAGIPAWQPLHLHNKIAGWKFADAAHQWAITRALTSGQSSSAAAQAQGAFLAGEQLLQQAGMSFNQLARTWVFMDDILSWYGQFNGVRNELFLERELLRRGEVNSQVPASTGMGVTPAQGGRVSIEFLAVAGNGLHRLAAAGKQRAAYEYGSAFARAATLPTPAGETLFISGTAAIDAEGHTCFLNDIPGQIGMTMQNLLAVAQQARYAPEHTVQAIAYCKTPAVAQEFIAHWQAKYPWPWVIVIGDVCRDDLLFEAELTALRRR